MASMKLCHVHVLQRFNDCQWAIIENVLVSWDGRSILVVVQENRFVFRVPISSKLEGL